MMETIINKTIIFIIQLNITQRILSIVIFFFLITLSAILTYPILEFIEVIRYATSAQDNFPTGSGLKRFMRRITVENQKRLTTTALTLAGLALFEYYRVV